MILFSSSGKEWIEGWDKVTCENEREYEKGERIGVFSGRSFENSKKYLI